jgi:hypothetical protein
MPSAVVGLKGLKTGTPVAWKSQTLRVTTMRPCSRAVAAIVRSSCMRPLTTSQTHRSKGSSAGVRISPEAESVMPPTRRRPHAGKSAVCLIRSGPGGGRFWIGSHYPGMMDASGLFEHRLPRRRSLRRGPSTTGHPIISLPFALNVLPE